VVAYGVLIAVVLTAVSVFGPLNVRPAWIDAIAPMCSVAAIVLWLVLYRAVGRGVLAGVAFAALRLVIVALPDVKLAPLADRTRMTVGVIPVILAVALLVALSAPRIGPAIVRAVRSRGDAE
jgi:hypothetical protein